jgi:exonuclease SbcC
MIKFNYQLIKNEGDQEVIYMPSVIPNEIDNLVYIKAANSSGKSTFLNIIALGLYGLKHPDIDKSLLKKMNSLMDPTHQKLNAEFSIENRKGVIELISKNSEGKIKLIKIENGKEREILSDRFMREYNLIYDIPHDPTDRLKELTQEIETFQQYLGNDISEFSKYLANTIKEIQGSRDPKRLSTLEKENKENIQHQTQCNKEIVESDEKLDVLKRYFCTRFFKEYLDKRNETDQKIRSINRDEELKSVKKKKTKLIGQKSFSDMKIIMARVNNYHNDLTKDLIEYLPKEQLKVIESWKKFESIEDTKIDDYVDDEEFGEITKKQIDSFLKIFDSEIEKGDFKIVITEWQIYHEIIQFFERLSFEYKNDTIILPGVDKTINDFIRLLIEKNQQNAVLKKKYDDIKLIVSRLKQLKEDIDLLKERYFNEYQSQKDTGERAIDDREDLVSLKLQSLRQDLLIYQHKYDYYKEQCGLFDVVPNNLDKNYEAYSNSKKLLKIYKSYTESQLEGEINSQGQQLTKLKKEKSKLDGLIKHTQKEIERLEEQKEHKYTENLDLIEKLQKKTQILSGKIKSTFKKYITNITDPTHQSIDLNDQEQNRYYNELSKYLAKRLDTIIYVGKTYKVNKLDLIDEVITTDSGKTIKFTDFGTGESQATFLKGILETARTDKRKIIALFDEVGMIDDIRLSQVTDSLKKLFDEDRLLVGIVVQKAQANEVEIKKLI